jgi:hypothetical protein
MLKKTINCAYIDKRRDLMLEIHLHTNFMIHPKRVSVTILNNKLTKLVGKQVNKQMQIH